MSEPYNAAERGDVKQATKRAAIAQRQSDEIVSGIMSIPGGRQWMHDRLEECHIFATSFHENHGIMSFAEGERNVGLRLLSAIMRTCPDRFTEMMREQNERVSTAGRRTEDGRRDDQGPDAASGPDDTGAEEGRAEDAFGPIEGREEAIAAERQREESRRPNGRP